MNVYLQEQVIAKTRNEMLRVVLNLPSYALFQVVRVPYEGNEVFLISVYCFDDEVDVTSLLD